MSQDERMVILRNHLLHYENLIKVDLQIVSMRLMERTRI